MKTVLTLALLTLFIPTMAKADMAWGFKSNWTLRNGTKVQHETMRDAVTNRAVGFTHHVEGKAGNFTEKTRWVNGGPTFVKTMRVRTIPAAKKR